MKWKTLDRRQAKPARLATPDDTMEADIPSRRVMLRGALAAGCGLLFPASLRAAPAASAKVPQASVQYQTQPKDGKKCADCLHFIAESKTCKLVAGSINPNGWCVLWTQKGAG